MMRNKFIKISLILSICFLLTGCLSLPKDFVTDFNRNTDYHFDLGETYQSITNLDEYYYVYTEREGQTILAVPGNIDTGLLEELISLGYNAPSAIHYFGEGGAVYYFEQVEDGFKLTKIWSERYKVFGYNAYSPDLGEKGIVDFLEDEYGFERLWDHRNANELAILENNNIKISLSRSAFEISFK